MTITVHHGENVAIMRCFDPRFALAYLDPPFFSQRAYETSAGEHAFDDRWPSLDAYLDRLEAQVAAARALLIPEGSLVVHVDPTVSHYVKVMGDRIFGRDNFANEIVWRYRRWPTPTRAFQWMHDVLLRWALSPADCRWNQLYEPLSASTTHTFKQRKQHGLTRDGRKGSQRVRSIGTEEPSPGAAMSDVWEISLVPGKTAGPERTGYPTQKPEALLARLIDACTNAGDWVLDPFCGSGTTLAVCAKRGRNAVGIDQSEVAIRYTNERLAPILAQGQLFTQETA